MTVWASRHEELLHDGAVSAHVCDHLVAPGDRIILKETFVSTAAHPCAPVVQHSAQFPLLHPERAKAAHPELVEGCGTHFLTLSQVKKQLYDARC